MRIRVQKNDRTIRDRVHEMKTNRKDAMDTSSREDKKRKSEPETESHHVEKKKSDAPSLSKKRSSSIRRFFMSRSRRKDARTDNEHDHKQLVTEEKDTFIEDDTADRSLERDEERLFKLIKAFQECDDDSESFDEHEPTSNDNQKDSRDEPDKDFDDLAAQVETFRKQFADRPTSDASDISICADERELPLPVSSQNSTGGAKTAEKDFEESRIQSNELRSDQLSPSQSEEPPRSNGSEQIQSQKGNRGSRSSNLRNNKFKRDARQLKVDSIDEEKLTEVKQDERREDGIPHAVDRESEKHFEPSEHIQPKKSNRRVQSNNLRNNKFKRDARKLTVGSFESDEDKLQNNKPRKSDNPTVLGEQIQPKRSNRAVTSRTNLRNTKLMKDAMSDDVVKGKSAEEEIENAPKPTDSNSALSQGTGSSKLHSALANSAMFAACSSYPKTERQIKETVKALKARSERNGFKDITDEIENSIAAKDPQLDEGHSFHESKQLTEKPFVEMNHINDQLAQDRYSDHNQDGVDSELEASYQAKCNKVNPPNKHDLHKSDSAGQTKSFEHTYYEYVDEASHRGDSLAEDLTSCQYEDCGYEVKGSFFDLDRAISAASMNQQCKRVHNSVSNNSIQVRKSSLALGTSVNVKPAAAPAKPPRKRKIDRVPSENPEAMMQSLMATEATYSNRGETEKSQRQEPEAEENGVEFVRRQKLELQANPPAKPPRIQKIDRVPSEDLHARMQSLMSIEANFLKGAETETQQPENRFEERLNYSSTTVQPPPLKAKTSARKQEKQTSDYALEISPGSSRYEHNVNEEKTDEETDKTDDSKIRLSGVDAAIS